MNNWLFFALLAPLLWAVTNVADSALRRHFIKDELALTWMTAVTRLPIVILFFLLAGVEIPSATIVIIMFIGGVLWTFPMLFYFKAMEKEDPSRIALLLQLVPLFTLLIAYFALSEKLTGMQWIAFALLIIGGSLAAIKRLKGVWHFSNAFFLIAIACFLWASSDVIFKKFEMSFSGFLPAVPIYFTGSFLVSLFIFFLPKVRTKIISRFFHLPLKAWLMIIATTAAGVGGSVTFAYALTLGKASLTSVMIGIQPLYVLILGLLLSPFAKEFHKEDLGKQALLLKGVSFLFVIAGLVFLEM
jgi:drug/metabolite transporter (DMT)-like permease